MRDHVDGSIQQDTSIGMSKQQESLSDFEPRIPLEIPSALLALELMKTGEIMSCGELSWM